MRPDRPIRVIVADQERLFRAALRVALESELDIDVIGEAADGPAACAEARTRDPDVVILDAALPGRDGITCCADIKSSGAGCRVLVLSEHLDSEMLLVALEAGADGYSAKDARLADVVEAVRTIAGGEACVPSHMLGFLLRRLIDRRREDDAVLARFSRLSRREREVLALLAQGLDHDGIAARLFISPQTARTHIQNVLGRLGVHSRVEAIALANEFNLLERFATEAERAGS